MLITGCKDGKIRIISLETFYNICFEFDSWNNEPPTCLRVSNDGATIVCGFESQTLVVYDTIRMNQVQEASWRFIRDKKQEAMKDASETVTDGKLFFVLIYRGAC